MKNDSAGGATVETVASGVKRLIAKSISGNLEAIGRIQGLVSGLIDDRKSGPGGHGSVQSVNDARWLELMFSVLNVFVEHSLEILNDIVSVTESTLRPGHPHSPARSADARTSDAEPVTLNVRGKRGDRLSAPFLVENNFDHPHEVTFDPGPFQAEGRGPIWAVVVEPAIVVLAAKERKVVHATVVVNEEFDPGLTYQAEIRIVGLAAKSMRLLLTVEEGSGVVAKPKRNGRRRHARPVAKRKRA